MTTRSYVAELISTIKYYHLHDQYAETADILCLSKNQVRHFEYEGLIPSVSFQRPGSKRRSVRFLPEVIERIRREGIQGARRGRPRR